MARVQLVAVMAMSIGVFMATGVDMNTPFGMAPAGAASCAAKPGDHVAVVIDFGAAPGAPSGLLARCVSAGSGWTGKQALIAAAGSVGRDSSGKVCQIAGIPARFDSGNCSAPHDGVISYWSYFKGSAAGWAYSSVGDAQPSNRVEPDVVEGWRFVEIADGATKSYEPPRNFTDGPSSAWQSTCPLAVKPPAQTLPPRHPTPPGGSSQATRPDTSTAPPQLGGAGGAQAHSQRRSAPTTSTPHRPSSTVAGSTTTSGNASGARAAGGKPSGLTSSETAERLTPTQVRVAAREAKQSTGRTVWTFLVGAGVIGCFAVVMVALTYRSRTKRRDSVW